MHSAEFSIRTKVFEGPLDLLLTLIEKRKLLINDISLSCVTDDFIAYTKKINDFPISQAAHFVLIASTLLLLKSRSLLPTLSLTDEEEGNIEDLEHRLKLYKYFKKLSHGIADKFGKNIIFPRTYVKSFESLFSPQANLTIKLIDSSIKDVIKYLPKGIFVPEVTVQKMISLESMIESLANRIQKNIRLSFKEFSGMGKSEKINVILSFLALLELVKQELIAVNQEEHFGDIQMENQKVSVPIYSQ